jgi:hypothetical protein
MRVGAIELNVQRNVQYTGRKCRIGKICFNENDRMVVFVGYCPECNSKVTMTIPDARRFADSYADESRGNKLLKLRKKNIY